ncbi:MAG: hypothetical protein GY850_35690 [bacterium]|nr:hypothetical protein [bacterium]
MSKRDEFIKAFKVPPVFQAYLDHIAGEREMDLVLTLQNKKKSRPEITASMGWSGEEAKKNLTDAVIRGIILKDKVKDADMYTSADFHIRLVPIAINENWRDIPPETREAVEELHLKDYIEQCRPVLEEIKMNPDAYHDIPNRDMLLLDPTSAL